jgi:hypothetical protein
MSIKYTYRKQDDYLGIAPKLSAVINGKHFHIDHPDYIEKIMKAITEYENGSKFDEQDILNILTYGRYITLKDVKGISVENGHVYLEGIKIPMPKPLVNKLQDANDKKQIESLKNFWFNCLLNLNKQARIDFNKYVETFGVPISVHGYAILYKSVASVKNRVDDKLVEKANRFMVKNNLASTEVFIVDGEPASILSDEVEGETFAEYLESNPTHSYTSFHKGPYGGKISIGKPVKMPREKCDPDINQDCSYGLHVGSYTYVNAFNRHSERVILACYVNPADIVALPEYDHSKIRVSEYTPYAEMATDDNGDWEEIKQGFTEDEYLNYDKSRFEKIFNGLSNLDDRDDEEEAIYKVLEKRVKAFN